MIRLSFTPSRPSTTTTTTTTANHHHYHHHHLYTVMSDSLSEADSGPEPSEYSPSQDLDLTPERTERVLAPSHIETPDKDAKGRRAKAIYIVNQIIEYSPAGFACAIGGKSPRDRRNIRAHVVDVKILPPAVMPFLCCSFTTIKIRA